MQSPLRRGLVLLLAWLLEGRLLLHAFGLRQIAEQAADAKLREQTARLQERLHNLHKEVSALTQKEKAAQKAALLQASKLAKKKKK